jgi:hypothetical protein
VDISEPDAGEARRRETVIFSPCFLLQKANAARRVNGGEELMLHIVILIAGVTGYADGKGELRNCNLICDYGEEQ